jgi:cytochrome c
MKKRIVLPALLLLLAGCSDKPAHRYDGEKLLKEKCAACHNLDMPPKTTADEKAPPMMAVTFHVRDFMKVENPSEKRGKFIAFVADYVLHPSAEKSFCDKKSLEEYGVMPSQKGKVTEEEAKAIAAYMYDHYDPEKFMQMMTEKARLAALPPYRRVLERKNCLGCHGSGGRLAPTFERIARRYMGRGTAPVMESIRKGSRGKWKGYKVPMPPHPDLTPEELEGTAKWILEQAEK